ncbi:MAG TPA: hypothetical protein EYN07_07660 [Flavobacteriaceae bacterium]|nr:hypothetical protein [Flavobacteriaceae bacterium]HBR52958.1 hypothetical protein [Flavobacteriaceae bacterium]HIB47378.1 hypothetical protein [Flavobacteriaceae bacterium]HIN99103.1 hypothetical protein [Flavobacteriaceae bacterium]|tara:strand:+ start:543 stop:1253 length:711 start_codon:yes stop_codon:yes gene_type:complete
MRLSLFILASSLLLSCNNIPEAILLANTEKVDTLDVNEYTHVIDKKNRRGYVTAENEVMNGRYVITREGTMTQEFTIEGGFLHGTLIQYYDTGSPERIETYKKSVQHGPVTSYYRSGAIRSESSYVNGEEADERVEYTEDGTVSRKIEIKDGIRYDHQYINGNRAGSMFEKTIEGVTYDLIVKYDAFGTVQLIMGKIKSDTSPILYIFDETFTEIEHFNVEENPLKARQYFALIQG